MQVLMEFCLMLPGFSSLVDERFQLQMSQKFVVVFDSHCKHFRLITL